MALVASLPPYVRMNGIRFNGSTDFNRPLSLMAPRGWRLFRRARAAAQSYPKRSIPAPVRAMPMASVNSAQPRRK